MVAIKDFEMPNTCGDCPCCIHTADEKRYIGYCNTSDDDYYCKALDRFMEYDEVDGGVDILGKPLDCPLVEAIPKADYEARFKADMAAMLTELSMTIGEIEDGYTEFDEENKRSLSMIPLESVDRLIQEKIDKLKADQEGKND